MRTVPIAALVVLAVLVAVGLVAGPMMSDQVDDFSSLPVTSADPRDHLERPDPAAPIEFGLVSQTDPAPGSLVVTTEWGIVPSNQVIVLLEPGVTVEEMAAELGDLVIGRIDYIGLVQLSVPAGTAADLAAVLAELRNAPGVATAFPNLEVALAACGVLDDPVYAADNAAPYEMIGVSRAWDILEVLDLERSTVTVGVADSAVSTDPFEVHPDEFDNVTISNGAGDRSSDYGIYGGYTHADGILRLLAADTDDGGVAGIAAPLGPDLSIIHTNIYTGDEYIPLSRDDGEELPTVGTVGGPHLMRSMVSIMDQIEDGATIINGSFGASAVSADNASVAQAWRRFFTQMADDHPEVLFVFAAGNESKELDGTNDWPGGMPLANVITVGNVTVDGQIAATSNRVGEGGEVTLGAPGEQSIWGVDALGTVVPGGGTSSAAPMVTATAALIRSVNPLLSASEIKQILRETATEGPDAVGGRILRVDRALLGAVNLARETEYAFLNFLLDLGDEPLTMDDIPDPCETADTPTTTANPAQMPSTTGESMAIGATCVESLGRITLEHYPSRWDNEWIAQEWTVVEATGALGDMTLEPTDQPFWYDVVGRYTMTPRGWLCLKAEIRNGQPESPTDDPLEEVWRKGCQFSFTLTSGEQSRVRGDRQAVDVAFELPDNSFELTVTQHAHECTYPGLPITLDIEFRGDPGARLESLSP